MLNTMFYFSCNPENLKYVKDLSVSPGTVHSHFADVDQPEDIPENLRWRVCSELCPERLIELIMSYMERKEPQRISVTAFQLYLGIYPEREIKGAIDEVLGAARGTQHVISICTLRYLPSSFIMWDQVSSLNKHIAQRAQEEGLPLLNLHRSFLCRQGADWVTAAMCYQDFVTKEALGSVLSEIGVCRYRSRIVSFHGFFDQNVAVIKQLVDQTPLPLWETFQYTEDPVASELLSSLGYDLKTRDAVMKEKRVAKKKAKRVAAALAEQEEAKRASVAAGQEESVVQRGRRQEKGRKRSRARSFDTEKVSVTRPYNYQLMSIDAGTFREMVSQIGTLKENLRKMSLKLQETEDRLRNRDNTVTKMEVVKDKMKQEMSITRRSEKATEFRCKEAERYISRQAERHHSEQLEWREAQAEWRAEKKELEQKLEQAEEKARVQALQMSVWEDWVRRQSSSKKK